MNSISVIIIGFNEGKTFESVTFHTDNVLKNMFSDYEIILVNDGSTDDTADVLERLRERIASVRTVHRSRNGGIGAALRDGYMAARKEFITCLAADGQIDPSDINRLYAPARDGADFVLSYYTHRRDSLLRDVLSWGYRIGLFLLFGPLPRMQGSYLFRRVILGDMKFYTDTFVFNYELIIKAYKRKYKFAEIPTTHHRRQEGRSKVMGFRKIWVVVYELLKLRWLLWSKGI